MNKCSEVLQNCSISQFKQSVYPAAYLFIFVIGLIANVTSLLVFLKMWRANRSLSSVNIFLLNLTVSDLMLICTLPFRASYYINDLNWVFGDVTCRIMSYALYVNMYGGVFFLMVLSVVRYVAITRPYTYRRQQKYRYTWVVCLFIWLLVSLTSIPNLYGGSKQDGRTVKCLELVEPEAHMLSTMVIMNYWALFLGFIIPFFVILICYVFVVHRLLTQAVMRANRQQYKKSCSLVIIVLVIFLASFLPYHVVRSVFLQAEWDLCIHGTRGSCRYIMGVRKAAVVTQCLAVANSCLDPLLYIFVGENFRKFWQKSRKQHGNNNIQEKTADVANVKTELQLLQHKFGETSISISSALHVENLPVLQMNSSQVKE